MIEKARSEELWENGRDPAGSWQAKGVEETSYGTGKRLMTIKSLGSFYGSGS